MAATNSIFANDTSITLDWADVSGANLYHLQVGTEPDFSGSLIVDDDTLAVSTKAFTDSGGDDQKRYWRWRSSANGGTTWSEWSEVGSYWLDTSGAADVTLTAGEIVIFDPDDVTDLYTLPDYPMIKITDQQMFRVKERNRTGNMLSEWYTSKGMIMLMWDESNYMRHEQMRALKRFNVEIKTFFLAFYRYNGSNYVPHIWKVLFSEDPEFDVVASGREDYFIAELLLEET